MKVMLHYKLVGAVEIDVPADKIADENYMRKFIDEGHISDMELIGGIEGSDAWGIDGDAIEIFATTTLDGETITEFK